MLETQIGVEAKYSTWVAVNKYWSSTVCKFSLNSMFFTKVYLLFLSLLEQLLCLAPYKNPKINKVNSEKKGDQYNRVFAVEGQYSRLTFKGGVFCWERNFKNIYKVLEIFVATITKRIGMNCRVNVVLVLGCSYVWDTIQMKKVHTGTARVGLLFCEVV